MKQNNTQSSPSNTPELSIEVQSKIDTALREYNHFWWGCVIGIAYGTRVDTIRVNEKEEPTATDFIPIARVKYLSPYDDKVKSRIVKWYDKTYKK